MDFQELEERDRQEWPYMVYHEETPNDPPKFKTWGDALAAQKLWNKDFPGHKAMKRRAA